MIFLGSMPKLERYCEDLQWQIPDFCYLAANNQGYALSNPYEEDSRGQILVSVKRVVDYNVKVRVKSDQYRRRDIAASRCP